MNNLEWDDAARDEFADIWVAATPDEGAMIEPIIIRLERDLIRDA